MVVFESSIHFSIIVGYLYRMIWHHIALSSIRIVLNLAFVPLQASSTVALIFVPMCSIRASAYLNVDT